MQSEGTYQHRRFPRFEGEPKCSMSCPACAYAEGRKAMDKDFKELLEMANRLQKTTIDGHGWASVLVEFEAWKKARGIE